LPSYIKDTTDFIKKLQNFSNIDTNSYLVTLDVSSLYSNIPHDEGINACKYFMENGSMSQGFINSFSTILNGLILKQKSLLI
jgi:hypothetical protein